MSNFTETQKSNDVEWLKKARATILDAKTADILVMKVVALQMVLSEMRDISTGAVRETIQRTMNEIEKFWLHDVTRADVCKWIQTIICELNNEK